jgi:hypothetical protein
MKMRLVLLCLVLLSSLCFVGCEDEQFGIPIVLDYEYFTISWIESEHPYMHSRMRNPISVEVWTLNIDWTAWRIEKTINLKPYETKESVKWMLLEDINYIVIDGQSVVAFRGTEGR